MWTRAFFDSLQCPRPHPLGRHRCKTIPKEVVKVTGEIRCLFYRGTESETMDMGCDLGYCDLDFDRTICQGHVDFCERPDALRRYLIEQKRKWERRRSPQVMRG